MRAKIEELGGEYRFESKVVDIDIVPGADGGQVRGVVLASGENIASDHVVLAVGHSARDTFEMLHERGVYIEAKPFSIGFRIEHPQSLIDSCRFGPSAGHPILGAADYKLVHHASNGRSVYSFCMCPGGTVVAAASEPGRVVTNGMSQYSRNERNANGGIVVGITPSRLSGRSAGRHRIPARTGRARLCPGRRQLRCAGPAGRRLPGGPRLDRVRQRGAVLQAGRAPDRPGAVPARLRDHGHARGASRHSTADQRLRPGRCGVDGRGNAHLVADPHQRRDDDLQSLNTRGLFPAGEGAGYAGGILSAAVDGIKVAEAVAMAMADS